MSQWADEDDDYYDERLMPPVREEPDEAEQAAQEHEEHCEKVHGGANCDCPPVPADPDASCYSDEPPF